MIRQRESQPDSPYRTASERLFAEYLDRAGAKYSYDEAPPGKRKCPDYRVRWNELELICEVKELHARSPRPNGAAHFNPYAGIRKEIHEARKQFREYKEQCCVLVLYNVDDWEFRDWPYVLFGAMLGDYAIRMLFDQRRGVARADWSRPGFHPGAGKMRDPKSGAAQNTTISALAVLREFTIPNPAFEKTYSDRIASLMAEQRHEPTTGQLLEIRSSIYAEIPLSLGSCPRVTVFENPDARRPLPPEVFRGPYDARHQRRPRLGRIVRVFAGSGLEESERLSNKLPDIARQIDRYVHELVNRFKPQQVLLFGSHAYGHPDPDSDVDLLVVFGGDGDATGRSLEIRKQLNADFPLDLITRSSGDIERRLRLGDSFLREVLENGRTLYPHEI